MHQKQVVQANLLASTHTNGGDHSHLQYGLVNFAPYSQLAIKMRLPKHTTSLTHSRGSMKLDATFQPQLYRSFGILATELCDKLNKLELRTAPPVRFRLQYASSSAYQRIVKPTLAQQFQSTIGSTQNQASVMATTMSLASSPMHALTSIMANQLEQNQDVRTTTSPLTIHSWSKRRNDSPAPSPGNIVPSFMRDTLVTRAAQQSVERHAVVRHYR